MPSNITSKRWFKWALGFIFWTIIGLSFASQFYLSSSKFGRSPVRWSQALSWSLGDWYVWAILSVPIFILARKFPLERPRWKINSFLHLAAAFGFSFVYIVLRALVGQWQSKWQGEPVTFQEAFQPLFFKTIQFNFLTYWVIVAVAHVFFFYRKSLERERQSIELEKRLAEARLQALQMQLNPHFLFNTLHAISALMHSDIAAADRMLIRLSELLRYALHSTKAQKVPLHQEISFLRRYLEIEETRFGARLKVDIDIPADALEIQVPNLILQPIVENSIRHGLEPHPLPGRLVVSGELLNGSLILKVSDNGVGFSASEMKEGVGISNTRARLEQLYGNQFEFEMLPQSTGGTLTRLVLPANPADLHED